MLRTMKAISAATIDSLADYAEVELPLPEPAQGQLRIRVATVSIGYVDAHLLTATLLTPGARLWTRDVRLAAVAGQLGVGPPLN